MGGLLGGSDGGIEDRLASILIKVFEEYDVEPGELNENMNKTVEIIQELYPIAKSMEELSGDLEGDVNELQNEVQNFNKNSSEMAEGMNNLATSLDRFSDMMEQAVEESEEK